MGYNIPENHHSSPSGEDTQSQAALFNLREENHRLRTDLEAERRRFRTVKKKMVKAMERLVNLLIRYNPPAKEKTDAIVEATKIMGEAKE